LVIKAITNSYLILKRIQEYKMQQTVFCGDFATVNNRTCSLNILREYDCPVCANLEGPVTQEDVGVKKAGPNLKISYNQLDLLKSRDIIMSLANNHIMDYGKQGLLDTIKACEKAHIAVTGAGVDLCSAQRPVLIRNNDISIGIIGCCETQFGNATEWQAGVHPVCPKIYRQIQELRGEVDLVIISIHGAAEMCPWPSPQWQDLLRSFIDAGATIVHGHHSHIPQGYEEYQKGLILYGLGNFLADPARWRNIPNSMWSIICDMTLSKNGIEKYHIKTAAIEDNENIVVRETNDKETSVYKEYLSKANYPLKNRKILTGLWQESSIRMYHLWNAKWLGFEKKIVKLEARDVLRILGHNVKKLLFLKHYNSKQMSPVSQSNLLHWYHLFACESHRESISAALGVLGGELEDMRTDETCALADQMMPWSRDWQKDKT
jgi:poly-gamma-glutamate synthesis protein (capsule biosynthesis protein)